MNKKSFTCITLVLMMLLTSCGSTQADSKQVSQQVEQETEAPTATKSKDSNALIEESNSKENFLEEWFSMGTYERPVAVNGEQRDEEKATTQDNHCILPQCSIITIMGRTMGREWEYANVSEEDAKKIVDLIENSKLEGYEKNKSEEEEFPLGIRLSLVILNSKGEYSQIILYANVYDKIEIEWRPTSEGESQKWVTAPNKELIELMKKYTSYRLVSDDELENITELEVFYKNGETKKLDKSELKNAKELLIKRERTLIARDYEYYDIPVIAKTSDGQEIKMFLYERQGEMIIEGGDYEVSSELVQLLMEE